VMIIKMKFQGEGHDGTRFKSFLEDTDEKNTSF
jgi:hypothetical protein